MNTQLHYSALNAEELLYLGIGALIGSVLGFLAFNYVPKRTIVANIKGLFKSISLGLFMAFPLYLYLEETEAFGKALNLALAGLGAFGLPDVMLRWWPRIIDAIASRLIYSISDGKCDLPKKKKKPKRPESDYEDEEG